MGDSEGKPEVGWTTPYPTDSCPPLYPHVGGASGGLYPEIGFTTNLLSRAQTYMECPICLEILMAPIYQCPNGHIICSSCIDKVESCGECRVPLQGARIRNVALEYICQTMEVKCPNGCPEVTTVEILKSHLTQCTLRPIPLCSTFLGWSSCSATVSPSSTVNHLREVHQVVEMEQAKFCLRLIAPFLVSLETNLSWNPVLITAGALEVDVLLKVELRNGHISFSGCALENSENCKSYRVKFQLDSCSKSSRLEWTGSLLSFYHPDSLPNVNTLHLPVSTLKEFFKPCSPEQDGTEQLRLQVKVAFWKNSDDEPPFQACFQSPTGDKLELDKILVVSHPPEEFSRTMEVVLAPHPVHDPEHYFPNLFCGDCNSSLVSPAYRCLQCPMTYFCRECIERRDVHRGHLLCRVSSSEQQPLAEVVYECCVGELA